MSVIRCQRGSCRGDAHDLVVRPLLVGHAEHADGPTGDQAARERRLAQQDECVQRVAVLAEGVLDEAVVGRVLGRGEQRAVEADPTGRRGRPRTCCAVPWGSPPSRRNARSALSFQTPPSRGTSSRRQPSQRRRPGRLASLRVRPVRPTPAIRRAPAVTAAVALVVAGVRVDDPGQPRLGDHVDHLDHLEPPRSHRRGIGRSPTSRCSNR